MNENLLIDTKYVGDYRIKIYYDSDPECPVKNWDMGAEYLFESLERGRYWLSSVCDWKHWVSSIRDESMESLLQRMAAEVVEQKYIVDWLKHGKFDGCRLFYNKSDHSWELQTQSYYGGWDCEWETTPSELKSSDIRSELLTYAERDDLLALISECAKDFVIKEWDSCGYSQGDHIRGVAYMSKERFDKLCGFNPNCYKDWKEQAIAVIEGEVKCISMWAWGDVKGYVLEKKVPFTKVFQDGRENEEEVEWEEVFSCWGYYMETEELINEVISEYGLKDCA